METQEEPRIRKLEIPSKGALNQNDLLNKKRTLTQVSVLYQQKIGRTIDDTLFQSNYFHRIMKYR